MQTAAIELPHYFSNSRASDPLCLYSKNVTTAPYISSHQTSFQMSASSRSGKRARSEDEEPAHSATASPRYA